MKAALIDDNNIVVNIIVWDDTCVAPEGTTAVVLTDDFFISTGWIFNGGESFIDPNPPVAVEPVPVPTIEQIQMQLASLTAQFEILSKSSKV